MTNVCEHGQLARVCAICERDAEIKEQARLLGMSAEREAMLESELKEARQLLEVYRE